MPEPGPEPTSSREQPSTLLGRARELWTREQVRFLIVGGWNTVFGYGFFLAAYALLRNVAHYLVIGVIAHVVAVTQSFVMQRAFVFRAEGPWLPQYLRFHVGYLGVFAFGFFGLIGLVEGCGLTPPIAQGVLLVVSVAASYFIHKHFSFRKSRANS